MHVVRTSAHILVTPSSDTKLLQFGKYTYTVVAAEGVIVVT